MRRRLFIAGLGSAATWPVVARAQQVTQVRRVGILSPGTDEDAAGNQFRLGLGELGYAEGRNVEFLYRHAEFQFDLLPALANDLVRSRVAVILAAGVAVALAAKSVTATVPIVFGSSVDPIEVGLVASFSRPGGNATGTFFLSTPLITKRIELLHEIVPAATAIGFLQNPARSTVAADAKEAETAARILGIRLVTANASTPSQIEPAFASLSGQGIGGLLTSTDRLLTSQYLQLVALAARHRVPVIYTSREKVAADGLMSYGVSDDIWRLAGTYVGRILKGEKPADLPVQQSTRTELAINLKTAKALGLTIPETLLATADEVIQ